MIRLFFDEQPGLFDSPLDRRFAAFHKEHPEVYDELLTLTRQAKDRGRKRMGIKMLFEVTRWYRIIEGLPGPDDDFKLNNNFHSRYARLIMDRNPDLAGIFETRELRT